MFLVGLGLQALALSMGSREEKRMLSRAGTLSGTGGKGNDVSDLLSTFVLSMLC
jgi:hypothetical protein